MIWRGVKDISKKVIEFQKHQDLLTLEEQNGLVLCLVEELQ